MPVGIRVGPNMSCILEGRRENMLFILAGWAVHLGRRGKRREKNLFSLSSEKMH
jgi:hypothetical protein